MKKSISGLIACAMLALYGIAALAGAYEDIIEAIKRDDPATVTQLLSRGVTPDTIDPQGNTLVIIAAREGSMSALRTLVNAKANVRVANLAGEDALMHAAIQGHLEIVRFLLDQGADANRSGWSPLIYAAVKGDLQIARLLLARGSRVDAGAPNGFTALMMAVREGHAELVRLLLDHKADPNLETDAGLTALGIAKKTEQAGVIADLLKSGAR